MVNTRSFTRLDFPFPLSLPDAAEYSGWMKWLDEVIVIWGLSALVTVKGIRMEIV
jgi:hypothetical protein